MDQTISNMLELLKCSLNQRPSTLPTLSTEEWERIYWLARKHGVVTMINDVIETLPAEQQPQGDIALSWALSAERTRFHYQNQSRVLESIRQKAKEAGIQLVVLKGIGLSKLYPIPSSRACGDIDIFFPGNYSKGNEILGCPDAKLDGKHAETIFEGVTVENHLKLLDQHYISQRKAERYIQAHATESSAEGILPPMANMVYLLMHTVCHLTAKDKLPMRNILDWGMFLRANNNALEPKACNRLMQRIGMVDAFNMLTYIAGQLIDTDLSNYIIGHIRKDDVEKMRRMILYKEYMAPLDRTLPLPKLIITRIKRNRSRRWLYRYLPSSAGGRAIGNIIRLFYKG